MLDIGWTELLVVAIILIVVVGPKDLPPMIRAFGRTMANLRKVTGEFRTQFDQALKEADMDEVRKTISDVQSLNPTSALRDAINPLKQIGSEIKSDLEKTVSTSVSNPTVGPVAEVKAPEPQMKLPDSPPVVPVAEVEKSEPKAEVAKANVRKKSTKGEAAVASGEVKPKAAAKAKAIAKPKVAATGVEGEAKASAPAKKAPAKKTTAKKKTEKDVQ